MRLRLFLRLCFILSLVVVVLLPTAQSGATETDLQPGDILFMSNPRDPWYSESNPWTHISIYVGDGKVVEAVRDGVRTHGAATWGIGLKTSAKRLRDVENRSEVVDKAVQYSQRQVGKRFDYFLVKNDDHLQYCSELMWHAYMQSDIDLDSNGGWLVMPSDEYQSDYLVQVY